MPSLALVGSTLGLLFVLHRIIAGLKALRSIDYLAGHRSIVGYGSIWFQILPRIKGISLGKNFLAEEGYDVFQQLGCNAYSTLSYWPVEHSIFVADVAAIKDITTIRRFPKSLDLLKVVSIFGDNIVASEGEQWKKYRKIGAPSFSEKNSRLVLDETMRIVNDLMDNVWEDKDAVVDHAVDVTLPLALLVIGAAGFGQRVSWEDDANAKPGNHRLTFREALHTTATDLIINILIPDWMKSLHPRLRRTLLAKTELKNYMLEMIHQGLDTHDRHDLFGNLIRANEGEVGGATLTEEELMGNIFIFLIAGHETTAHTLAFTFALLALYPDIQEKLLKHIREVLPDGRRLVYEDIQNLTYVMAVYNETLRMFPPVTGITRVSPEDTSILVGNPFNDEQKRVLLPKGTVVAIHVQGVHYNPKYWENPNEFIPERFLGDWDRDHFLPFNVGPRACLGRKFNETESVTAITSILRRYKVEIKEEPQFAHETFAERRARILKTKLMLTISPKRLPLVFRRRAD